MLNDDEKQYDSDENDIDKDSFTDDNDSADIYDDEIEQQNDISLEEAGEELYSDEIIDKEDDETTVEDLMENDEELYAEDSTSVENENDTVYEEDQEDNLSDSTYTDTSNQSTKSLKSLNDKKKEKEVSLLDEIFSWVKVVAIAVLIAWLLNRYLIFNFSVPTESMENTIMVGNRITGIRVAYLFTDPERGDIVVFPYPDNPTVKYIKRIIGLPGETIEGRDGLVYINGEPIDEPYVASDLDADFGPYDVPEDSYFMMGDNRDISADARYWQNKFVKKDDIIARAVLRYYPGISILK